MRVKLTQKAAKVRIDPSDLWSVDYTIARTILPLLKAYRRHMNGSPHTDNADVPEALRSEERAMRECETLHEKWEWIVDEMIYAMKGVVRDGEGKSISLEESARIDNGLRLFGRYFRALWT